MKISFSENAWQTGELDYAYSYRFDETPVFVQKPDCIENRENPGATYGFDNISLLTPKKYGPGTTISTRCAFRNLGAPLLVLSPWMEKDRRGANRYGDYIEVVLWKNGVNVWQMWYRDGEVTWKQLLGVDFPVSEEKIHSLSVTVGTTPWRSPPTTIKCCWRWRDCTHPSTQDSMPARASTGFMTLR